MRIATNTRISTDEEHQPFSLEAHSEPDRGGLASRSLRSD